ncbi:ABC transporter permease [bacterium]|jgi:peptide/nickel transport system permease protein|nr:ABC transporter permease [bacterium]
MKPLSLLSLIFLTTLVFFAIFLPFLSNTDPNTFNPDLIGDALAPSLTNWFGTDDLGRDLFIRTFSGAKISILVAVVSVSISISIGLILGLISGYSSKTIDSILMRFVDLMMAIPTIFLILTIQVILTPSIWNVMIVIGLTSWMGVTRIVRAEVLSIREQLFITAAKARGISNTKLLFKHILPHTLPPVIVAATLGMGSAILTESVLSFLGLGVQPPNASWGNMLDNSLGYMRDSPWMAIVPGTFITLTVLALNILGDDCRAKFNPKET